MKSTARLKDRFCSVLIFVSGAFFCSCGLDVVLSVEEPTTKYNTTYYNTDDGGNWFIDFETKETGANQSIEGGKFLGTEVYYKIYNNYSNLVSHNSAINSVNTTSNGTAAATKLTDTYSYKKLLLKARTANGIVQSNYSVFVPSENSNRKVYFRPKTYTGSDSIVLRAAAAIPHGYSESDGGEIYNYLAYTPTKRVVKYKYVPTTAAWTDPNGNSVDYADIIFYEPFRNVSEDRSFDFFDDADTDADENVEPESGDEDFWYSATSSAEDTYYVQFYAVGVAMDSQSCTNVYSLVLDLGSMPIKKGY